MDNTLVSFQDHLIIKQYVPCVVTMATPGTSEHTLVQSKMDIAPLPTKVVTELSTDLLIASIVVDNSNCQLLT